MCRFSLGIPAASEYAARQVLDALGFLAIGVRLEFGCLECSMHVDGDSTVRYTERWASEEDLKRHVCSSRFVSILEIIEASARTPQITFHLGTDKRGLDYVEEARAKDQSDSRPNAVVE